MCKEVSIDHFFDYCNNGCPFFEKTNNKQEYYCYIDGMLKKSINCYKKRIIFDDEIKDLKQDECYFKNIKEEQKKKLKEKYKDFSDGFSDCMNGLPVQKNNKDYIEGYSKAKLL